MSPQYALLCAITLNESVSTTHTLQTLIYGDVSLPVNAPVFILMLFAIISRIIVDSSVLHQSMLMVFFVLILPQYYVLLGWITFHNILKINEMFLLQLIEQLIYGAVIHQC